MGDLSYSSIISFLKLLFLVKPGLKEDIKNAGEKLKKGAVDLLPEKDDPPEEATEAFVDTLFKDLGIS